jgi:hypothetical protein
VCAVKYTLTRILLFILCDFRRKTLRILSDTANYECLLIAILPILNNPLFTEIAKVSVVTDCTDSLSGYRDIPSPEHVI